MTKQNYTAQAIACSNIALIKYWGKRDLNLNLPAVGSISMTLDELTTRTSVTFQPDFTEDILILNDRNASEKQTSRVSNFLNIIRKKSGISDYARVNTLNNFPTGAGLASSASAFAALSLAATKAAGLNISQKELSILARRGSGSAARSIYGGYVEMQSGPDPSGNDDFAIQLFPVDYWDLRMLILITSHDEKMISSTEAMIRTEKTSPYYNEWVKNSVNELKEMRDAIARKNFQKTGELAESNALKMHALTLSSHPPVIYWNETSILLMHAIQDLRRGGTPVFFTIDAGAQIKALTLPEYETELIELFSSYPGVKEVITCKVGSGALLIGEID